MTSKITNATNIVLPSIMRSDKNDIAPEIKIVAKKIVITQRTALFRSFFDISGSDLDTGIIPFVIF